MNGLIKYNIKKILLLLSKYRMHRDRIYMINIKQYDMQRELEKIRNHYKENKNPVSELKFPLLERQSTTNEIKKKQINDMVVINIQIRRQMIIIRQWIDRWRDFKTQNDQKGAKKKIEECIKIMALPKRNVRNMDNSQKYTNT